ncbi:MAG: hypothetical protein NTW89_08540 [Burkholderiales bacterium]|nr:hypothetical protein [Burkholderiales bacterium]
MSDQYGPILIYNPLSGHGHLDAWNALVVSFLLERGERVFVLTPDLDALTQRLSFYQTPNRERLTALPWQLPKRSLLSRIFARLLRSFQLVVTTKRSSQQNDPENNYLEPSEMGNRIAIALKSVVERPSFIFNMYMDLYRTDAQRWSAFDQSFDIPWAGIRFIPNDTPTEAYYDTNSLRGMCLLDETVAERYQRGRPDLKFVTLPDVIDASLLASESSLVQHIKSEAKGRTIVFMGGTIGKSKNLAKWYELIQVADASRWYFVQIGEVLRDNLLKEDVNALQNIEANHPENLYRHTEYLSHEQDFNAAIQAADIVFAVYRDFKISSNMLGKAARFKKPLVVADNYLMGERVRRYQIGYTALQDDAAGMLHALHRCIDSPPHLSSFQAYEADNSPTAFKEKLFAFLEDCRS